MDKSSPFYIRGVGHGRPEVRMILEKLMNLRISLGYPRAVKIPGVPMAVDILPYTITGVYTEPSHPGFTFTYSNQEDLNKLRNYVQRRDKTMIDEGGHHFTEKFGGKYDILYLFVPLNNTDECYISLGEFGEITEKEANFFVGPSDQLEHLREVITVKKKLAEKGINLDSSTVKIRGVFKRPRPIGFKFDCANPTALQALVNNKPEFAPDDRTTVLGHFAGSQSNGESFRQISSGESLHIIINTTTGECDAHLDTHGFVNCQNDYSLQRMIAHGYFDLLGDKASYLFRNLGDTGTLGPWFYVSSGRFSSDPVFQQIFPGLKGFDESGGHSFMVGLAGDF